MSDHDSSALLAHESIRASAGSGKTYQLVIRYLRLTAAGAPPANILASTFTRLAAGEIRDRILMRLANSVDDAKNRRELAADLGVSSLTSNQVSGMLASLAGQLHRMNVRTLDSFFASVVRCFAMELSVPAATDMLDDNEAASLRAEALQLMLDEHDAQKLIDLLRLLTQGSSERSVMTAMDNIVSGLYELYRDAGDEPWNAMPRPARKRDLLKPAQVIDAIALLEACPIPLDKKSFVNSMAKNLTQARSHDWEEFVTSGLAGKIALNEPKYSNSPIPPDVVAAYTPLVNHARAEIMNRVADQTAAMRDLLQLFGEHYEALKARRGAMTFSDVTHAMGRAEELGTLQDIGFRLDGQLHHLLLDEFQDTSIPQWRALEPIAKEIVSNAPPERTFFCVGDVKLLRIYRRAAFLGRRRGGIAGSTWPHPGRDGRFFRGDPRSQKPPGNPKRSGTASTVSACGPSQGGRSRCRTGCNSRRWNFTRKLSPLRTYAAACRTSQVCRESESTVRRG
jgi:ATP-dependent exoDNAse (exonuclease V) beta subunit